MPEDAEVASVRCEEARLRGRGTRLFVAAMIVACVVLVGPSAPSGAVFARALPVDAAEAVVPNRVMTWNLCNPCGVSDVDRAAEIATYAPQVVGVQEACDRDVARIRDFLKAYYGLEYHVAYGTVLDSLSRCGGPPWNPGGFGQAILSAAPMTDVVRREYPDGGSEDRGYLAVTTLVDGRPIRVFNTHLAQRRQESVRAEQVPVLAREVARFDRAVVLGDFNAVPEAPELGPMWKVATDVDPECRPTPTGPCEPTTDWQSKFDYVFLRGVDPVEHGVRPTVYSDHHPLLAEVDVP